MAKPNSLTTVVRMILARLIDPMPPAGKTWCIGCSVNGGFTSEIDGSWCDESPPDKIGEHMALHSPMENLTLRSSGKARKCDD
jgi:hypothetical protein